MPESNVALDDRPRVAASPSPRERAAHDDFARGQPGYSEYCLGRHALLDAGALSQSREGSVSAALLYRAAAVLFGKAHELRQELPEASSATSSPSGWLDLPAAKAVLEPLDPERRRRLTEVLALPAGEAKLASLGGAEREELLGLLKRLALELAEPLERDADGVRRRNAWRWLRRALAWAFVLGVAWAVLFGIFGRTNLARNALVTTSSGEARVRANPRALVDGDRKNLGFHTKRGRGESATIDLGAIRTVRSVEIYNRFDCCQNRALPLRLESSTDGVNYELIARRTDGFMLWKVPLPSKPVRFLRVTDEATNFFHLSEVEVY